MLVPGERFTRFRKLLPAMIPGARPAFSALFAFVCLAVSGCATNPATGARQIAPIMSPADEAKAGAAAHPKILKAYGGAYNDEELGAYVAGVTARIVRVTNQPDGPYQVTILDSPVINAFALPGGYVYVTRGLMSLANDEAELASVIGHEIGHVAARHSAQRHTAAVGTSVLGAVLGAVVGSGAVNQIFGIGGQGLLASYSRDQEYEADLLGVRYLAAAGYDPYAAADFLGSMNANESLEAKIRNMPERDGQTSWLASHPATPARIEAALVHARETGIGRGAGARNRDVYLSAIDNMLYGDNPAEGIVRENRFVHPVLRFAFDAPKGFAIVNAPSQVSIQGPERTLAKFDMGAKTAGQEIGDYLGNVWASGVRIGPVERFTINGMKAATSTTVIGNYNARLVAIEFAPEKTGRFILGTLPETGQKYTPALQEMVMSFRKISATEAQAAKPLRLRVVTARQGDSVASLARHMGYAQHQVERFRVLNGLSASDGISPGARYKIVAE